jgi:glutathione S-transferase
VLAQAQVLGVEFDLKNVYTSESDLNELLQKGGKYQVPFLVDSENNVSMYESEDIISYLENNVGAAKKGVRVHKSEGTSNVCG